jgi:hypothetical protein
MANKKKKLYALLVGIDDYRSDISIIPKCKFGPLAGCVNDTKTILDYLTKEQGFQLEHVLLKNEEATKEAIVDAMKNHLGKAGEDDVAFFYYSGHGIQEYADRQLWPGETDGRLECLVCYPLAHEPTLLADKELRFLIREIANGTKENPKLKPPHVLTIFDCCHSGENTRNGFLSAADTRERRIKCIAPQRDWANFVFKDTVATDSLKSKPLSQVLPEGIHVHLSACESDESALEVNGQGVFTSYLINILKRARGNITYYDLMSQVRHYLNNTFTQKPQLRLPGEDSSGNFAIFLNKSVEGQPLYGNVIYNHKNGWVLDMGSLMGITQKIKRITMTDPEGETFTGKIDKIQPDETWIKFRPVDTPNKKQVYKATIKGIMAHPVKIFVNNFDGPKSFVKELLEKFQENTQNIALEEVEAEADYSLQIRDFMVYLTKPQNSFRPMVRPESLDASNAIDNIVNYLRHISNWEFVKRLKNASTYLFRGNPLKIEAFSGGQDGTPLAIDSNTVDLNYTQRANGKWAGKVAIKLTNTTTRKLYVSALYLLIEFRVYLKGMEPQVYSLEPGESVWLFNYRKSEISYSVDDLASNYNWPATEDFFKIIVSTTPFDVTRLEKKGLPKPTFIDEDMRGRQKGLDIDEEEEAPKMEGDDWTTQDLTMRFHNPLYNQLSGQKMTAMLEEADMIPFVNRLFFDRDENDHVQIKPELQISPMNGSVEQLQEKAAQKFREAETEIFRKRKTAFANLPTLVSMGDDWLHNLSVKNLSAQFSGYFNILRIKGNFGSADLLTQKLDQSTIKRVVISIGLNEISQGHSTPVTEQLETWAVQFPQMEMIVHGYDYFPSGVDHAVVDLFNESLKTLADQYDNFHYLDLRGSLQKNQWNSPSLPNDDGMEKLAGIFLDVLIQ